MSKTFWRGFREGYRTSVLVGTPLIFAVIAGWSFGMYFHPYEKCARMYKDPQTITECVIQLRDN